MKHRLNMVNESAGRDQVATQATQLSHQRSWHQTRI